MLKKVGDPGDICEQAIIELPKSTDAESYLEWSVIKHLDIEVSHL